MTLLARFGRSSMKRTGTVATVALACAFALDFAACASNEDEVAPSVPEGGALPSPADASTDGDASDAPIVFDAGPCSDSGLCIAPVAIDTRINVTSISGSGASDVWAVGTDRTVLHYDGASWEKAAPVKDEASPFTMRAVWTGSANDVWIADGPLLRHSTGWRGPTATEWGKSLLDETGSTISAISGRGGRVLVGRQIADGFGSDPPLLVTTGWGADGIASPEYPPTSLFGADGTDGFWSLVMTRADEAWGTKLGTDDRPGSKVVRVHLATPDGGDPDAGGTWEFEEFDSRTARNLYGVWGTGDVVWVVGEGGVVRRLARANIASRVFETVPTSFVADLRGIYGFGEGDIWAVGDDATVIRWNGSEWKRLATPFDHGTVRPRLFTVWGSSPDDVWIGGNGVMLHFEGRSP